MEPQLIQNIDKKLTNKLASIAEKAALESGKYALENIDSEIQIFSKEGKKNNLVTEIDRRNQKFIISMIKDHFPDHSIIGEEDKKNIKPQLHEIAWLIDPIDGTTNFVNRIPIFSVSIGVLFKGIPIAGAIWTPWMSEKNLILKASFGNGATINNKKNKIKNILSSKLSEGGIATLPSKIENYFKINKNKKEFIGEKRVLGSCAFEMMLIAKGISAYGILGPASSWDFAAGVIIIRESGGEIFSINNKNEWERFKGFHDNYQNNYETIEHIRNWKGIMAGVSKNIVNFTTNNFTPLKKSK